ncbi:hypothetical protein VNO77_04437 [Canavalia gladiata]|uniref:Uncharacterized protein n=1 Tax=Canavalia gladiata TaxID=3824 RepID=A0AAN9R7S4_CANGL
MLLEEHWVSACYYFTYISCPCFCKRKIRELHVSQLLLCLWWESRLRGFSRQKIWSCVLWIETSSPELILLENIMTLNPNRSSTETAILDTWHVAAISLVESSSVACAAEEVQEWCSNPTAHNFDFKVLFQGMCASHAGKWTSPLLCQAQAPHMTVANWTAPNLVIRASSIGAQQTQGHRKVS